MLLCADLGECLAAVAAVDGTDLDSWHALALVFGWFFLPRGRPLGAATGQEPAAALG